MSINTSDLSSIPSFETELSFMRQFKRTKLQGKTAYLMPDVTGAQILPSVSAILAIIPKPWLDAWKKRVGEEQAKKISKRRRKSLPIIYCIEVGNLIWYTKR